MTQFLESQYTYLLSRLRRVEGVDIPLQMRAGSNPADDMRGEWVASRFVPDDFTPDEESAPRVPRVLWKDGRAFLPARVSDNPHLDQAAYDSSLLAMDDPILYSRLRLGDWRVKRSGNIWPAWSEDYHIITRSQFARRFGGPNPPKHWERGVSQDWGFAPDPCATIWLATAAENSGMPGRVFLYRFLTIKGQDADQIASEHLIPIANEYDEWATTYRWLMSQEAATQRHTYNRLGVPFNKWGSDALGGLDTVARYLRIRNTDRPHPFNNVDANGLALMGEPWLYVVVEDAQRLHARDDEGAAMFRAEIAGYRWATQKSGEFPAKLKPQDKHNHYMDALRCYAAVQFPGIEPLSPQEETRQRYFEMSRQSHQAAGPQYGDQTYQYRRHAMERIERQLKNDSYQGTIHPDDDEFDVDDDPNPRAWRRDWED